MPSRLPVLKDIDRLHMRLQVSAPRRFLSRVAEVPRLDQPELPVATAAPRAGVRVQDRVHPRDVLNIVRGSALDQVSVRVAAWKVACRLVKSHLTTLATIKDDIWGQDLLECVFSSIYRCTLNQMCSCKEMRSYLARIIAIKFKSFKSYVNQRKKVQPTSAPPQPKVVYHGNGSNVYELASRCCCDTLCVPSSCFCDSA